MTTLFFISNTLYSNANKASLTNPTKMEKEETIEQFISNLETNFYPDAKIEISHQNLRYLQLKPGNKMVTGICDSEQVDKEQDWDSLILNSGESKVTELVSTLKTLLPTHKDKLIIMTNKDGFYSLVSSNKLVTKITVSLDASERGLHARKHPRIIEHNKQFLAEEFWNDFNTKMNAFRNFKHETNTKTILKVARSTLVCQSATTPDFELSPPYFYLTSFYRTHDDILTKHPDAKDVKFSLFKKIMVTDSTLTELEKTNPTTIIDNKLYWIELCVFTMNELLEKYTLTEAQLTKFFVEVDIDSTDSTTSTSNKKLVCSQPDILKAFEK